MTFQEKYAKVLENEQNTLQDEINKVNVAPYVDKAFKLICKRLDGMVQEEHNIKTIKRKIAKGADILNSFSLAVFIYNDGIQLGNDKKPCVVFRNMFFSNEVRKKCVLSLKEKLEGVGIDFDLADSKLWYMATLNLKRKEANANS